ncbi:MAG: LptF/LptG family permease [Verrucomicrobia bacterium]|nr:LptF/LptG family permease [Verrucomicrobiota bacterium]MBU4292368.1 LptF/LptG family permease [Verrucomicrobiota bacterium]MBU4427727.1 LptF/LptG family permease [Verrucomicrobiota bacterium]MCG2680891.1 LptF/LptG family permease [Kiritimatiellia bacterium]
MRILNAYITRNFLVTFIITLLVFLFIMALGNIFRVIDLFSRGVSGWLILKVFSYGMPFSLIFAIPMSVLAAIFLLFSRLASDREIIAMKACGISVWQIIQPPVVIASLLCVICIYINCNLAPNSHYQRRLLLSQIGVETPLSLLDEGRFIRDFPRLTIYIGKKEGYQLTDIVIYSFNEKGLKQTIRAKSGTIVVDEKDRKKVQINLHKVRMDQADENHPEDLSLSRQYSAEEYPLTVDMTEVLSQNVIYKKRADLTILEIIRGIRGSVLFVPADIKNLDGFVRILRRTEDQLSEWIQAMFSDTTVALLKTYDGSEASRNLLRNCLVTDFNRLICGPPIYDADRFAGVKLTEATKQRLAKNPRGEALLLVNRMVLEDTYPSFVTRSLISELNPEDLNVHRMALMVEASTRLALSFSCYAFVLLGAALGAKIHRKESSIGIAVSLALVFFFYFFIIIADSLVSYPKYQPHLIVWIPFVLAEVIGFYLIQRSH